MVLRLLSSCVRAYVPLIVFEYTGTAYSLTCSNAVGTLIALAQIIMLAPEDTTYRL